MKPFLSAAACLTLALALALVLSLPSLAQSTHTHGEGMDHGAKPLGDMSLPSEPGQGAFAAIAEIVALLRSNPWTDWSRVDIAGLRQHLVDMNRLVMDAEVAETPVPGGLSIEVSLGGPAGEAAGRMVPAHAPVLAAETGWLSSVTEGSGRLVWTVAAPEDEAQIRALGFFGLMALGDHHREHHLGLATGSVQH
jgi:hypothetical protein